MKTASTPAPHTMRRFTLIASIGCLITFCPGVLPYARSDVKATNGQTYLLDDTNATPGGTTRTWRATGGVTSTPVLEAGRVRVAVPFSGSGGFTRRLLATQP